MRRLLALGFVIALTASGCGLLDSKHEVGDAESAGDPFILQNGQYTCGRAPNMKLEKPARR